MCSSSHVLSLHYKITGDVKLTESNAIIRYIARKHGLDGKTETERVRIDMMENLSLSLYMEFARVAYSPDFVSVILAQNDPKLFVMKSLRSKVLISASSSPQALREAGAVARVPDVLFPRSEFESPLDFLHLSVTS